jgi:hypothetical protein
MPENAILSPVCLPFHHSGESESEGESLHERAKLDNFQKTRSAQSSVSLGTSSA